VVRTDDAIVKLYGSQATYRAASQALATVDWYQPVPTARCRRLLHDRWATVQEIVPGVMANTSRDAKLVGGVLRRLHDAELPGLATVTPARRLAHAEDSALLVCAVMPALTKDVTRLLANLAATMPDALVMTPSHGDFEAGQVVVGSEIPDGAAIIDFDELCLAAPALDVANFVIHGIRGTDELDRGGAILDEFLAGYGPRPEALDWHLAASALYRASAPFRKLQDHWRERMAALVRLAVPLLEGRLAA
jgi:Ser/Thr protein kinase RdoA (MazF antagonist)